MIPYWVASSYMPNVAGEANAVDHPPSVTIPRLPVLTPADPSNPLISRSPPVCGARVRAIMRSVSSLQVNGSAS